MKRASLHNIQMNTVSEIAQYERAVSGGIDAFNKQLEEWQNETITALRANIRALGIKGDELYNSLIPTRRSCD